MNGCPIVMYTPNVLGPRSLDVSAEAFAEVLSAGGTISVKYAVANVFLGAGVDLGAKISVQRGDGHEWSVFGGDRGCRRCRSSGGERLCRLPCVVCLRSRAKGDIL